VGAQRWVGEDRMQASEACDAGSIPAERTTVLIYKQQTRLMTSLLYNRMS